MPTLGAESGAGPFSRISRTVGVASGRFLLLVGTGRHVRPLTPALEA